MSLSDSLCNLQLIQDFCQEYLNRCCHFTLEDMLHAASSIKVRANHALSVCFPMCRTYLNDPPVEDMSHGARTPGELRQGAAFAGEGAHDQIQFFFSSPRYSALSHAELEGCRSESSHSACSRPLMGFVVRSCNDFAWYVNCFWPFHVFCSLVRRHLVREAVDRVIVTCLKLVGLELNRDSFGLFVAEGNSEVVT